MQYENVLRIYLNMFGSVTNQNCMKFSKTVSDRLIDYKKLHIGIDYVKTWLISVNSVQE